MQKSDIIDKVKPIVCDILRGNKIELIDMTYRRRGRDNVLSIFADTDSGITLDECAKMNEVIGAALDKEDIIEGSYLLEVSSPGLDRPLKTKADFMKEKGKKIRVHTHVSIGNKKEFTGRLDGVDEENILIVTEKGDKLDIAFDKISSARLSF